MIYSLTPKDSILRGKAQNLSEDIWHWNAEYDRNDGETAEAFKNRIISHNKAYNEQIQALNEQRLSEYEKIKRIYAEHFKTCKDHAALEETCDKALLAAFKENGLDYNKDGSLAEDGIGKNILASIFELSSNYASINGCEKCTKDYR